MATGAAFGQPDYQERAGSLTLRGDHMNYSRAVLVSNWNQAREAEPKDYTISIDPNRNLKRATYDRLASITDGTFPKTTYQDHCDQVNMRDYYLEREERRPMVNTGNFEKIILQRDTGRSEKGYSSVLPHHHPDHNKFRSTTTNKADFQVPYPYTSTSETTKKTEEDEFPDNTVANKKCHSQFSDTTDYRRPGRNTWQDESGIYANCMEKLALVKSTKDILPTWLH